MIINKKYFIENINIFLFELKKNLYFCKKNDMDIIEFIGISITGVATLLGGIWWLIARASGFGANSKKLNMLMESVADLKGDIGKLDTKIDNVRTELKRDIEGVRTELKADIEGVRTELKADIESVRTELKADISKLDTKLESVRTEFKTDIDNTRKELKAEIVDTKMELKRDINKIEGVRMELKEDIGSLKIDFKDELNVNRRINELSQHVFKTEKLVV
jgi:DNA repair exonuclease SbcCD ATPase subunit